MFLDVGIGLLLAMAIGWLTNTNHKLWLLIFGAVSSLAPDIDLIIYLIKHKGKFGQFAHEHRELLHKPLLFSFGVTAMMWFIGVIYYVPLSSWAILWCFATFSHFIHDTFEGGWGIQWFWPLEDKYYLLAKYRTKVVINGIAEQRQIATEHGNPDWFKDSFRWQWQTVTKIIFCITVMVFSTLWVIA